MRYTTRSVGIILEVGRRAVASPHWPGRKTKGCYFLPLSYEPFGSHSKGHFLLSSSPLLSPFYSPSKSVMLRAMTPPLLPPLPSPPVAQSTFDIVSPWQEKKFYCTCVKKYHCPNQQLTLNKLLTELRCRNSVNKHRLSITNRCETCKNVYAMCIYFN